MPPEDTQTQVETTTDVPSTENQTEVTNQEPGQPTQDNSTPPEKTVPYERFSEVVKTKQQLEARISELEKKSEPSAPADPGDPKKELVKKELDGLLKEMGYVSKAQFEQEKAQERADREVESTLTSLSSKYDGKDGRPKFDREKVLDFAIKRNGLPLEEAYTLMHQAELIDWHIKSASGKTTPTKSEQSDGSGSTQIGTTQSDLINAANNGDQEAVKLLIKRAI